MKTVMINKPNDLQIIEMDKPLITEHDNVLIKMKAAGICGSDVHIYHGQNAAATYPRVIGHEMVGEVVEVGSNVTKIKAGDRVIVDQVVNCGECYACRKGRGNVCANLKVRGVHIHGGYREYIAVPESDVYVLPDNLSYEDAVMIEPATIAVQSCSRAELTKEDTLLILGCGALGSSILKISRLSGATIIAVDVVDEKIEEAKKNGATYGINLLKEDVVARARELTGGYGPTVSIDAACTKDSLATLLELTGNAGRVITMGFSVEPTAVTQFKITAKELDVRGSRLQNKKFQEVLNLVAEGKLDLTNSISHKFNFLDAQKAFDFVDSRDPSIRKIVLTFDN
ncbi:zinc-binding alcohol dehydrogenase family protein [Clostridium beijerinckii]|uniref:zinc-binding alcohol dehydrogenase family protein n=1 Tax=Clostridium beijerinckii TaxID=1520 RepID=UPI00098C77CE|nr:zinc-binding alcohol dehydrogenase family protein [Clostridium beijerinckii]NRT80255.1 L-gulonate 5-dehydrogenase [Clostridium beijerinckii]OOM41594.1 putative zinc-type alcohol dehydrogenase-like protein YjmD [Clostridium beijerinckii]